MIKYLAPYYNQHHKGAAKNNPFAVSVIVLLRDDH